MATPLLDLPPELAQQIFELLPRHTLRDCNLVCKWAREHASDMLWRDVMLTDRQRWHGNTTEYHRTGLEPTDLVEFDGAIAKFNGCDSHDDTPMIKVLFLLAKYPEIAAKVHSVTHRCHLPPPSLFAELPQWSFHDCTLSNSWDTLRLLRLAIANMKNVKVLRLVAPHHFIATTLLREFFSPRRKKEHPIQHLWLESLSLDGLLFPTFINTPEDFGDNLERRDPRLVPRYLDLRGLESLRFRRLWADKPEDSSNVRTRSGRTSDLHDGRGSVYPTTTGPNPVSTWLIEGTTCSAEVPWHWISRSSVSFSDPGSTWYNERIWAQLPEVKAFLEVQGPESLQDLQMTDEVMVEVAQVREHAGGPRRVHTGSQYPEELTTSSSISSEKMRLCESYFGYTMERILHQSMSTLTSLCLDWVMWSAARGVNRQAIRLLSVLSKLRFPHLRAFQYRNATSASTMLPEGVYLLTPASGMMPEEPDVWGMPESQEAIEVDFLSFLLGHDQITCLAWPIERFLKEGARPTQLQEAQKQVIYSLGQRLEALRIDAWLSGRGEPQTDDDQHPLNIAARSRRHRFIEEFAPYMTKLTSLKMEGGIPKDEQRQILHALRQCPLQKIVQIGVNQPLGNSWGEQGEDISSLEGEFGVRYLNLLEPEPREELEEAKALRPIAQNGQKPFEPIYGSPPSTPLLYVIASHFGNTITELKFCGYNGAPVLRTPPPITSALLWHLRYFPRLKNLAMSTWLLTTFEADWHESEVLNLWMSERKQYTIPTRAPIGWEESQVRDEDFEPMRSILERIQFEERTVSLPDLPQSQLFGHDGGVIDASAEHRLVNGQHSSSVSTLAAVGSEVVEQAVPSNLSQEMDAMSLDGTNASASVQAPDNGEIEDNPEDRPMIPPNTMHLTISMGLQPHPEDRLSNFINTNFRPRALADHVNDLVGEHLSSTAKARKGTIMGEDGVRVRATFCIGIEQSDIFELDVWIDQLGVCGYRGPIEEGKYPLSSSQTPTSNGQYQMYDMEKTSTGPIALLMKCQMGAVVLNLHKAMRICHLVNQSPKDFTGKQAIGRQHRKGQVRIVLASEYEVVGTFDNIQATKNLTNSLPTITALYGPYNHPVTVTDDSGNQSFCPEKIAVDDFSATDFVCIDGHIYHKSESSVPQGREGDGEDANVIDYLMQMIKYSRGIPVHVPTTTEAQAVFKKKAVTSSDNMAAVQPGPTPAEAQAVAEKKADTPDPGKFSPTVATAYDEDTIPEYTDSDEGKEIPESDDSIDSDAQEEEFGDFFDDEPG